MSFVEPLRRHRRALFLDLARRQLYCDLPGLSEISEIGAPADADLVLREALGGERRAGQPFEAHQVRIDHRVVETVVALDECLHVVVLEIDREKPEGRHVPW